MIEEVVEMTDTKVLTSEALKPVTVLEVSIVAPSVAVIWAIQSSVG